MSEIINLNKVRKARTKAQKTLAAGQNRLLFGLPADVRKAELKKRQTEENRHEGHRITGRNDEPDPA
ncbi:MAG: DUF4169 family protein [Asticcacaulis sp.]